MTTHGDVRGWSRNGYALAHGGRRTNAEAIRDAAVLGYLPGPTLDPTFGKGRFWTLHRPAELTALDLHPNPRRLTFVPCGVADFRELPFDPDTFGSVAFDPPYKLNGTSTGRGPSAADEDYGVVAYGGWREKHALINDGIAECVRVVAHGGYVLVKCQDQVCGNHVRWQTREFADTLEAHGCRLVDRCLIEGYREQPRDRRQIRFHADYSTLLVARKGKR